MITEKQFRRFKPGIIIINPLFPTSEWEIKSKPSKDGIVEVKGPTGAASKIRMINGRIYDEKYYEVFALNVENVSIKKTSAGNFHTKKVQVHLEQAVV